MRAGESVPEIIDSAGKAPSLRLDQGQAGQGYGNFAGHRVTADLDDARPVLGEAQRRRKARTGARIGRFRVLVETMWHCKMAPRSLAVPKGTARLISEPVLDPGEDGNKSRSSRRGPKATSPRRWRDGRRDDAERPERLDEALEGVVGAERARLDDHGRCNCLAIGAGDLS